MSQYGMCTCKLFAYRAGMFTQIQQYSIIHIAWLLQSNVCSIQLNTLRGGQLHVSKLEQVQ